MKTITVFCKNTNTYHGLPAGLSLMEIYQRLHIKLPYQVVGALVNNKVEGLNFIVYKPKDILYIDLSSSSGMRIYVRTLSMVMSKAVNELLPETTLHIEHPVSKGYYGNVTLNREVIPVNLAAIKQRMQEIINANLPVVEEEDQTPHVIELFRTTNQDDKVRLLETLGTPYTSYFRINNFIDYYNSVLLPSTGFLSIFDIEPYQDGFLLRVPHREDPVKLEDVVNQPAMFNVFKEFIAWNNVMKIRNVGDFNYQCKNQATYTMINVAEALQEKKVALIADMIVQGMDKAKLIFIAGPSSSGKTTFSKRLAVQLIVAGVKPVVISMDNYFVPRERTPRDENGDYDYETIEALDIELFNNHLNCLLKGEEVELPTYNFDDGHRYFKGEKIKLSGDDVVIMEGIHALNPQLTPAIADETKFKIYVSALTSISLDNHSWISTTDNRLIRRIVRDYRFRNYSARDTIARWPSVRKGEDKWIFPYQENADVMFNSALIFELAVLRTYVEPLLAEVPQYCDEFTEAHRLQKFLQYFNPIGGRDIPPTSLLREFLGGSSFRY